MTRSNRTLNRIVLFLVAAVFLASGVALAWPYGARVVPGVPEAPRLAVTDLALWVIPASALVLLLLALAWILSRGRGGTGTALTVGEVTVATAAVQQIMRNELGGAPSVLGVEASAHRLRGRTALQVTVSIRRGADLAALLGHVRLAVAALDDALGVPVPLVARITTGWRSGLARDQRAE